MDWTDESVRSHIQKSFLYGAHNSLCLAHGRKPIIPVSGDLWNHRVFTARGRNFAKLFQYKETPYPKFKAFGGDEEESLKCAMKYHHTTNASSVVKSKAALAIIAFLQIIA